MERQRKHNNAEITKQSSKIGIGMERRNWSLTRALEALNWLSVPPMAAEATIRGI